MNTFTPSRRAVLVAAGATTATAALAGPVIVPGTLPAAHAYTPGFLTYPFKDARRGRELFHDEIQWLATYPIDAGYTDGTFRPRNAVTRSEVAAFLMRLDRERAFKVPARSPYLDVRTNHPLYREIAWFSTQNISNGWTVRGGAEFRPEQPVMRDAFAAFVYRYASKFIPSVRNYRAPSNSRRPFVDVTTGNSIFYKEICWFGSTGISTGWSTRRGAEFRQFAPTDRGAMSAFMYRLNNWLVSNS